MRTHPTHASSYKYHQGCVLTNNTNMFYISCELEEPISPRVRRGDLPRGAPAVESHAEPGEAVRREVGEAPPPPCSTSARVEVGEPEARPKGPVPEHPVPYMFGSKLATRKAHCCGNIWFDQKLTGVLGMYVRANSSFVGHTGGNPGLGGRSGNGSRSPVAKNLWCAYKKNRCLVRSWRKWDLSSFGNMRCWNLQHRASLPTRRRPLCSASTRCRPLYSPQKRPRRRPRNQPTISKHKEYRQLSHLGTHVKNRMKLRKLTLRRAREDRREGWTGGSSAVRVALTRVRPNSGVRGSIELRQSGRPCSQPCPAITTALGSVSSRRGFSTSGFIPWNVST